MPSRLPKVFCSDGVGMFKLISRREGWVIEPRAAQMPHTNTKDLAIFPVMLRWHTSLALQRGGLSVLKEDGIWSAAKEVWNQFPKCKIARSYVLAHRIAKKVIDHDGNNSFLGSSEGLHCDMRDEFNDTV